MQGWLCQVQTSMIGAMKFRFAILFVVVLFVIAGCTNGDDEGADENPPERDATAAVAGLATVFAPAIQTAEARTPGDNAVGTPGRLDTIPAVAAARADLAARFERDLADVQVISATRQQWPDSCLGAPEDDEVCAQVITPGYEVLLLLDDNSYTFRTDEDGTVVRFAGLRFLDD